MSTQKSWIIEALPSNVDDVHCLRRFKAAGRNVVLAKTLSGQVYLVLPTHRIDLTESWGCNDTVRREYCRLTGRLMKELKAAISSKRQAEFKHNQKRARDRLTSLAKRMGYRLVKAKTS